MSAKPLPLPPLPPLPPPTNSSSDENDISGRDSDSDDSSFQILTDLNGADSDFEISDEDDDDDVGIVCDVLFKERHRDRDGDTDSNMESEDGCSDATTLAVLAARKNNPPSVRGVLGTEGEVAVIEGEDVTQRILFGRML